MTETDSGILSDASTTPGRDDRGDVSSTTSGATTALRGTRRVAWVAFALQLLAFGTYSTVAWDRYSLTNDFWLLYAPINQISHSGFSTSLHLISLHFDAIILWPLAWLVRLPPHGLLLSYAQDIAVVAAEVVAFRWVCELLQRRRPEASISSTWLGYLAVLLLVLNPWVYLTPAFDVHLEAFGTVFIVLASRALQQGRLRATVLWVALTLTCGFVAATYVAGLAIGALVAGRKAERRLGLALLLAGVFGVLLLTEAGGGADFLVSTYGYLAGPSGARSGLPELVLHILLHPAIALKALWAAKSDILVNLAPAGLIGIFWRWSVGIAGVVLLSNVLQPSESLKVPSYQSLPVYVLVAVGTVVVLSGLRLRARPNWRRTTTSVLATAIAADTLAWAVAWIPALPGEWLRVSPEASRVLAGLNHVVPPDGAVIVSQGVVGRFADRRYVAEIQNVSERQQEAFVEESGVKFSFRQPVWMVLAPNQGIETNDPGAQQALITKLVEQDHAKLVSHAAGIWGLRWSPPTGTQALVIPPSTAPVGGWVVPGPAGRSSTVGPVSQWSSTSNGKSGYVVSGDYFYRSAGTYQARVTLSSSGPVVVEAWNSTGNVLLSRLSISVTNGRTVASLPVDVNHVYPDSNVYQGWGPFSYTPPFLSPGNTIEIRVWHPASTNVQVYSLKLS